MKFIQQIIREVGILSASLALAFVAYLGFAIVQGQGFREPQSAPPAGNTFPPLTTEKNSQTKAGDLTVSNLFVQSYDENDDGFFEGTWVNTFLKGKPRYVDFLPKFVVPTGGPLPVVQPQGFLLLGNAGAAELDTGKIVKYCGDLNGCRITLSMHDYNAVLAPGVPVVRPGITMSRGPYQFYISPKPQVEGDIVFYVPASKWWKTSPQGFNPEWFEIRRDCDGIDLGNQPCIYPNLFFDHTAEGRGIESSLDENEVLKSLAGHEGEDNNGIAETILQVGDCLFTDGEYPLNAGGTDLITQDIIDQFSLFKQKGYYSDVFKGGLQPIWCSLEIED